MKHGKGLPAQYRLFGLLIGLCGSLLLLQLSLPNVCSAVGMKVEGTVFSEPGKPVGNTTVMLMKIVMAKKPTVTRIGKTLTDQDGRFEIPVDPFEENVFFRITAGSGAQMTGSDPFRLTPENPVRTIQLILPKTLTGFAHLALRKQLLVIEALEGALQTTEVIYFSNNTDTVIETGNTPFIKEIPRDAVNFQLFERQGRIQARQVENTVRFFMSIPPGEHQLLFSYNLPVDRRTYSFRASLTNGIAEFEMLTPVNMLEVTLSKDQDVSSMRIINQEKRFETRRYRSTTLFPNQLIREVEIRVDHIPISQARFYYPAMLLAATLIFGVSIFLAKKPRKDNA